MLRSHSFSIFYSMKTHKIILCFLTIFFLILGSCDTTLEDYLELQRTMIPVKNIDELQTALQKNGAVIGLLTDIEIPSTKLEITSGGTVTVFAWENNATLSPGPGFDSGDPLFNVINGTLILGHSQSSGTLILEGKDQRGAALVRISPYSSTEAAACTMNSGVVIRGNKNTGDGGGVHVDNNGTFTMNGGEISGNTAGDSGGGVHVFGGTFTMNGGVIGGNSASNNTGGGGGVFVHNGEFIMNNGAISNNESRWNGGGVMIGGSGTFAMINGTIRGNYAGARGGGVCIGSSAQIRKTGGTVFGGHGSSNSNRVGDPSYDGIAVYVLGSSLYRNSTAGPDIRLDSGSGHNWGE